MKRSCILFLTVCFLLAAAGQGVCGEGEKFNDRTDLFNLRNRFLEDEFPKAEILESTTLIDSFEAELSEIMTDWQDKLIKTKKSERHVTDGKYSLEVEFLEPISAIQYRPNWRHYWFGSPEKAGGHCHPIGYHFFSNDELRLDIYNPGRPVDLEVSTRDDYVRWWTHRSFPLKTGKNQLVLTTNELKKNMFRYAKILTCLKFSVKSKIPIKLYFDNFRWKGPGLGKNLIQYGKCFDFGAEVHTSPYFLCVSSASKDYVYTKERGYGWEKASRGRASKHNWREPDTALLRDHIGFSEPFLVDLPDGKYRMHVVEGYRGYAERMPCYRDLTVRINNGKQHLLRQGAKTMKDFLRMEYHGEKIDYHPGQDMWKDYKTYIFRPFEHDFEVKGGQAKIEITGKVSFMLIYPLDKADIIEPEIAALWQDLRQRFSVCYEPFSRKMAQELYLPGLRNEYQAPKVRAKMKTALALGKADRRRGYMLFKREPVDEVFPDTVPLLAEIGEEFNTSSPPGLIDTFTVNLFALRDLEDVRLELSEFIGPNGKKIPVEAVDLRAVRYSYRMNAMLTHGDWLYMVVPWFLVKRDRIDIPADTCRRFWINVDIPKDTVPGIYRARATLTGKNVADRDMKLELEVLPFKLDRLPANMEYITDFHRYYHRPLEIKLREFLKGALEDERNKHLLAEAKKMTVSRQKERFRILEKYGFTAFGISKRVKDLPWTRLKRIDLKDEKETAHMGRILSLRANREDAVRKVRANGKKPVFNSYYNLFCQDAHLYRFRCGFFMWRVGAEGYICGPGDHYFGDPFSPFDGHKGEPSGFIACSADWPVQNITLILEGVRQGITDYRYLVMLERLAEENKDAPAGKEAKQYLARLREKIHPNLSYYALKVIFREESANWSSQPGTEWRGPDYQRELHEITRLINRLVNQ